MSSIHQEIRRGFLQATPIMIGFVPLALILGVQANHVGQSFITAYLMTSLNFAGGSEFAVLSLWTATPPLLLIAFSTFLINSRHIIMGASLAPYMQKESGLRIFFTYFFMCDEAWALTMQDIQRKENKEFSFGFHIGAGLSLWLVWSLCTALGAFLVSSLGTLDKYGFIMALPATFIALSIAMRPKKIDSKYLPIIVSFIGSITTAYFISSLYSVGIGAICGLITAYIVQIHKEKTEKTEQTN